MTYTYVLMEVSDETYSEIRKILEDKGYCDQLHGNPDDPSMPRLNMHGIALVPYRRGGISRATYSRRPSGPGAQAPSSPCG